MDTPPCFTAILRNHKEAVEIRVRMERATDGAPIRLRVPTVFVGRDAFDVFDLVDADGWPDIAVFTYRETIPRTTADPTGP